MSDQQRRQGNQPELQQRDRQVVRPPRVQAIFRLKIRFLEFLLDVLWFLVRDTLTARLTEPDWIHELLTGDPRRIRTTLGVDRSTFTLLVKAMQSLGLRSSRHVPIDEQLSIFLFTAVTGSSSTFVGERFERSPSTIAK